MNPARRMSLSLLCLLLVTVTAHATPPDGTILDRTALQWTEAPAKPVSGFLLEKLFYASDGLRVAAHLYRPADTVGRMLPAIVFNRGGYLSKELEQEHRDRFERFAQAGFVVIAPSYRGSDGGEGNDEVGGADVDDVMNLLPLLKNLGYVDTGHLFMVGESRGGFMTFEAIRAGFPLRAAATVGATADFGRLLAAHPEMYKPLIPKIWPDFDKNQAAIEERPSAIRWVSEIHVPLLLMQGGSDRSVDPLQVLDFARELQKNGALYELRIFAEGKHTVDEFALERDRATIEWFRRFMERSGV